MAKANLTLTNGTTVVIEGTPEEVAGLLERFSDTEPRRARASQPRRRAPSNRQLKSADAKSKPKGATDYIQDLIGEDFFRERRGLSEVKEGLEARAHIYPVTTLSPALFRLVRKKELRRIKDNGDGQWKYVNW